MKKIVIALVTALTAALAIGESEPAEYVFPLDELEHHAVVSIQAGPLVSVPLPWDAYRITSEATWDCITLADDVCYFIPGVDKDTVYFAIGRYMNSEGHRVYFESATAQSWELFPGEMFRVASFSFFEAANGTVVVVRVR